MEMNMHVPQSLQAWMELEYLAAVPHHFISPSSNEPIIKPSQDNLLGVFKITGDDVLLTQVEAQHLLSGTEAFDGVLPEPAVREGRYVRWTGRQIYSVILPPISLVASPKNDAVEKVVIENGLMKSGRVDKGVSGKIVKSIHSEFGSKVTERYMNDLQRVISRYLVKSGFSVGVSDLVVHPDIVKKNRDAILETRGLEVELSKKIHLNILEDVAGDLSTVYDSEVSKLTGALDDKLRKQVIRDLDYRDNRVAFMVASGAKGKDTNIKQMMVALGQQTIDGGRVPINFTDRTHPAYPRYENGMESRGFVSSNFREGLHPGEFYFHAMSGRVGLIDTAVKTATSGYLQRKLVKGMEDLRTYGDGTIRDSTGEIVEFLYGGDMFDSTKLEIYPMNKLPLRLVTQEVLYNNYLFRRDEDYSKYMLKSAITSMKKDKEWQRALDRYNARLQNTVDMVHTLFSRYDAKLEGKLFYPVNIPKTVKKVREMFQLDTSHSSAKSSLSPITIATAIAKLVDEDCTVEGFVNKTFEILVYNYLSPKMLIRDYKFNQKALDYLLAQIRKGFQGGKIVPGEMVGPLAAQSIGEKATQLTLNSVDFSLKIFLKVNGNVICVQIGEYIDEILSKYGKNNIVYFSENRTEYLELPSDIEVYIPTMDDYGSYSVGRVTAVTRHLPVGDLVKITTSNGRVATGTQQKAFLIWSKKDGKVLEKNGLDLKLGDKVMACDPKLSNPFDPNNKMHLEPIIKIEHVKSTTPYVYDLTIPTTTNFLTENGICMKDTFHLAGVGSASSVTQGVPRLNELLTITKDPKTPSCTLYLKDRDRFHHERAVHVKNNIEQTKIRDILKGDPAFYLEPTGRSSEGALEEDKAFLKFYEIFQELDETDNKKEAAKNPWLIRMEFNRKEMIERSVSMADIQQILSLIYPEASLMYSDDNAAKLVFRVRIPFERQTNVEDDYKELHGKAEEIKDIIIKGVDNIDQVFVSPIGGSDNILDYMVVGKTTRGHTKIGEIYEAREEYRLTTQGSNLFDLLVRDDIDDTRSFSNDPNEMAMIYGIEAGKYTIEHEFYGIMDNPTNPRHISLLTNKITHNGTFMSINSHGINKEDIGPLAKCSFEETDRQLRKAALFGDVDRLKSVSANIIMGQIPACGTGSIRLFMDEEALEEGMERMGMLGKRQPTNPNMVDRPIDEDAVMDQFRSEICVTEDDQIRMGPVESDGLSLAHIPQVGVE